MEENAKIEWFPPKTTYEFEISIDEDHLYLGTMEVDQGGWTVVYVGGQYQDEFETQSEAEQFIETELFKTLKEDL